VGTFEGLSVYDAMEFKSYRMREGLTSDRITCIAESHTLAGTLWIGTLGGGIAKFSNGLFEPLLRDTSFSNVEVYSLLEDSSGIVWCGTSRGLYRVQRGEASSFSLDGENNPAVEVALSSNHLIYAGTENALFLIDPARSVSLKVNSFHHPLAGISK